MKNIIYLVGLIPLLPLVGFLINGLFRNVLSKPLTSVVGCGALLASLVLSILIFIQTCQSDFVPVTTVYFDFIHVGTLQIPFAFQVDQLSVLFLLIITGVGFLIHVYSAAYMHGEEPPHFARYFSFLNLFVFFMLVLVLGANYLILFIGWEGVGLCSYLLIGFWFKNIDYGNAAKKAFIMNRIGDLGFLIGLFWIISQFGTATFSTIFEKAPGTSTVVLTGITILLFVGATGKSAQIPLYTWLPDAMAGPTPVSALIHAATMVTAGIYMIARSNILYTLAPLSGSVVAITGLSTAVLAATIALKQTDIKKVLAYSTVSQLGYMFLGLGVGAYTGALFHVMTHAFFKALLFLGAGSVIHSLHNEQDIRRMGGLKKLLPVTHLTFLVGCLAIAGIPPFSGFFSKDEILTAAYGKDPIYYIIGVATSLMTAFYMFRVYVMTFSGSFRGTEEHKLGLHESPAAMTIPLIVLAILATIAGLVGIPGALVAHAHWLQGYLAPIFDASSSLRPEQVAPGSKDLVLMGISVAAALIGTGAAIARFSGKPDLEAPHGISKIFANKWYVDEGYQKLVVRPLKKFSQLLNDVVEKSVIDWGVNGVGKLVQYGSRQIRLLQSGQIGGYVLLMVVGMIILLLLQLFLRI